MSRLDAASPREAARRCEATGWDDLDAVDELALAFERALEGCRVAPLASRANALCAVLRVALDDDALDPAFALERETNLVDGTDPTLDPRAPSLSPLASRLLDAVGDRILGAIVVAADAAGTPEAEALACVAARAVAAACAPRDAFLMTLERLQARARQVADRDEDAPPRDDDDDDEMSSEARSRRGWRLAGALAESLGTLLRRLARDPTRFIADAAPLVRALALAADERHDDDDDDDERRSPGWGSPRDARVGIRAFVLAALDRLAGVALERRVSADDSSDPGDASPKVIRTVAISALSLLALEPRADAVSAAARALAAAGATRLDVLLALVDRDDSYSDRDRGDTTTSTSADAVEGAAHVARAWFVASESVSPSPNPRASAPLAGVEPTLASLAPLVHALFESPHGDPPARVRTLTSALDLAALGFRRAARGAASTASIDAAPAARRVVEALARVVAASPDPSAREKARLALSRAFACADASARFRLTAELLADAPSPAVAAMVLTRATRDAAAEWDVEPDFQVERAREEETPRGRRDARPDAFVRVRHSGGAGAGRGADTPRDRDARERCDVAAGARPRGRGGCPGRRAQLRAIRDDERIARGSRGRVDTQARGDGRVGGARARVGGAAIGRHRRGGGEGTRGGGRGGIDAREGGVGSADGSAPRGGGVRSRGGVCARGGKPRGDRAVDGEGGSGGESGGKSGGGSGGGSVGPRVDVGGRAKVPGMYWYRL